MPELPPTRIALIGMSGIGKSYWSKQLEQAGWVRYDCDAMIAQRLGELIEIKPGEDAVIAVGRWMGMPWTEGYAERECQYLELETRVTAEALDAMSVLPADQNAVLDTTGSVIYTGDTLLQRLKRECRVVYFEASPGTRQRMVELYCEEPKPVLWQGGYAVEPGVSPGPILGQQYRALLTARSDRYQRLQDITLGAEQLRAFSGPQELIDRFDRA